MASYNDYFTLVLKDLGLPATKANLDFLAGWASVEATAAKNNPLATTQKTANSVPLPNNSAGVQQYPSAAEGAQATADTLKSYPNILSALATGNILGVSFSNPPGLVHDFGVWVEGGQGYAKDPKRGFAYYQSVKVAAQGGSKGSLSAGDVGSYDLGNLYKDSGAKSVVTAVDSVPKFLAAITDPNNILRGLEVVGGAVLVLLGLWLLVRQVGLAAGVDVPSPVDVASATIPGAPAQKAARAAQTRGAAAAQSVQVRESRAAELHTSRVKLNQARATELRTRTRHRRRTAQEQKKELDRAYIRGAADTSPLGG